ncbi:protein ndvB, partial [Rhizobiaceae sp. 2RAB30]
MNVQTDPDRLQLAPEPLPAQADNPIRATFMPEEQLRKLGEALARGELTQVAGPEAFDFRARVRANSEKILEVYRAMNDAQARGETVTPAAQWLLDNFYVVEETVFQIKRDIPRRFYLQLPTITLPNGVTAPRALAIAWLYVAHCDSAISAQSFEAIVQGFQSVEPLRIGELWALPSLLRFVLIENLRRLALRVGRSREMRRIANELADRVLGAGPDEDRSDILPGFAQHARDTTFATQLLYRLRDGSQHAGTALAWLENELERSGSDAEEIILGEHHTLSSGNVTTGNIIRGLRLINDVDWTVWFEGISRVDTLLREGTDFASLDFPSRDQYRTAIEEMARRSGLSEYEVATRAIQLARQSAPTADGTASPAVDVGFFLVGPRRLELEQVLGYRPPFGKKLLRSFRRTGWTGIVVPVLVMTLLLLT